MQGVLLISPSTAAQEQEGEHDQLMPLVLPKRLKMRYVLYLNAYINMYICSLRCDGRVACHQQCRAHYWHSVKYVINA